MNPLTYPFDSTYILKKKKSIKKELLQESKFIEKRIALLSGSTIGEIKSILELFLLNVGIKPVFFEGHYNRFYEEAVYDSAELVDFAPDIIYIHTTTKNIDSLPGANDSSEQVEHLLETTFLKFRTVWDHLIEKCHCMIIQNNFEPLTYRLMGNSDCYQNAGGLNFVHQLNTKVYAYANQNKGFLINDINYLAATYGLNQWYDASAWYMYKYALSIDAIPYLCHNLANIIKSIYGKNKKTIILDLDNTIWGGIIGDDGIENIRLGYETGIGLAYLDFQKYLKQLSQLGIILNIASKNDEKEALLGLKHPAGILKEEDFVYIKANWEAKYSNINMILEGLNVLPESAVFIDDNPVERDMAAKFIPNLSIPILDQVDKYIEMIDKLGYFEITEISKDDLNRKQYYIDNRIRQDEMNRFVNYDAYLKSLEMKCTFINFNQKNIPRITQLINKTNQFNFTTRRYSEVEVTTIASEEGYVTFGANLEDKFGDNGIVSALIAHIEERVAVIDLWVMSCRVFKRDLELFVFDELVERCRKLSVIKIRGIYRATAKNSMIQDFYSRLNFKKLSENDVETIYEIKLNHIKAVTKDTMEVYRDE